MSVVVNNPLSEEDLEDVDEATAPQTVAAAASAAPSETPPPGCMARLCHCFENRHDYTGVVARLNEKHATGGEGETEASETVNETESQE